MRVFSIVSLFAIAATASPFVEIVQEQGYDGNKLGGGLRSMLYVTNWGIYGAGYNPDQLPVDSVSHLQYSFADILPNGTVVSSDPWADTQKPFGNDNTTEPGHNAYGMVKQLYLKKQANRNIKVLLAIGGFTWSPKFIPVAADPAKRKIFVNSAVKLMADWGMDGLDVDWEYPDTAEKNKDCVQLLRELRQALDEYSSRYAGGYHFTLSFPAPAGPANYKAFDFKAMDATLDFWSLMAFDFAGSWDNTTGHMTNVYPNPANPLSTKASADRAVKDYTMAGVSPGKLNLGIPMYGRSFNDTTGLGKPYHGLVKGSLDQDGIWVYKDLPRPGAEVRYDDVAKASYSFDEKTGELVSYDNLRSVKYKSRYVKEKKLGGVMYWEAAQDRPAKNESIVQSMAGWLGKLERSQNLLYYPVSQYSNIRSNMGKGYGWKWPECDEGEEEE